MKNLAAVILLTLVFFACKKQSDPLDQPSIQQNNRLDTLVSFSGKINGAAWHTDSAIAYKVAYAYDTSKYNILINAVNKSTDTPTTISFSISNFIGAHTYTINPPLISATYYQGSQRHLATSGQIVVTLDSNYAIIGTFNFVADSINVTQGVFNVETP